MHAILFSVKRTFHTSTWYGRGLLDPICLTPSRFDILYILHTSNLRSVWQSSIRKILGIAGPTLSIMIRALETLGFLERRGSEIDRRQIDVALTPRGRRVIRMAIDILLRGGVIQEAVERFVSRMAPSPETAFPEISRLEGILRVMRFRLRDEATLYYPWHPDD